MPNAKRAYNFNAGPAAMPEPVLEQMRDEMLNYGGTGMSVMEMSHRSREFEAILQQAEADLRALLKIPDTYSIVFLQGGAHLQFSMVPTNWLPKGASADYVLTGAWAQAAIKEAQKIGAVRAAASTQDTGFDRVPKPSELQLDPHAAYLHFTSNETIQGVAYPAGAEPMPPEDVPLICDASSDIVSRPLDVAKYALIYAGAQKNLGPSGVTLVIVRDDLLARTPAGLPVMLDYRLLAESHSLHNTPPTFGIYALGLTLKWLIGIGGLAEIQKRNEAKARLVYDAIDASGGFYRGHAQSDSRSRMNVTFRLPSQDLDKVFVKKSEAEGFVGLKGHRSVGGLRASLYNALPLASAEALAQFMREFQRVNR